MRIHPDAPSVAEIDLYQSSTRSCRRTNSAINRRQKLLSFFSRGCYGGDLHRRKRWCNLFRCPCLATPGKHQAGRYSVAPRNLSYLRARCQRLLDNPCLVVLRPTPPPLEPAQNLDPHRLMTLKLDLRSHASRITTRHARRSSSEAYDQWSCAAGTLAHTGLRLPSTALLLPPSSMILSRRLSLPTSWCLPDHRGKRINALLPWNWQPQSVAHAA